MLSLLLALFFQHLVIDGFFAFEDLKTHIGSAKVAADTDEVCFLRTAAIDDGVFVGLTDAGDADGESCERGSGVAAHDVDVPFVAGSSQSLVEGVEVFYDEAFAQGDADNHLTGCTVHGEDIADIDHRGLVAEMLHVDVGEVEVYTFHQHIGRHEYFLVRIVEYGAVIAHAVLC